MVKNDFLAEVTFKVKALKSAFNQIILAMFEC